MFEFLKKYTNSFLQKKRKYNKGKEISFLFRVHACRIKKHSLLASFIFFTFCLIGPSLYGQSYFRIQNGIPYLPIYADATNIGTPIAGMLVYDAGVGTPLFYTGSTWVDFCNSGGSFSGGLQQFSVIDGIPVLAAIYAEPGNPSSGTVYFSGKEKKLMVFDGSKWNSMKNSNGNAFNNRSGFHGGSSSSGANDFPVLADDPLPAGEGAIYISTKTKAFRFHNGTDWQDVYCGPVVYTLEVTDSTGYEAKSGGEVLSQGNSAVTSYGICWGVVANPDTTMPTKVVKTSPLNFPGTFSITMTDLLPNTTYHVRAFIVNNEGITYGQDVVFDSPIVKPTIITLPASNIQSMTAESGGDITANGGASITRRGIWWSVLGDPIVDGNEPSISDDGSGVGEFPSTLTHLLGNTTYYVRAYAINIKGTAFGNLIILTTPPPVPPELKHSITVSNITGSSGEVEASVKNNGGAPVLEVGACWWTKADTTNLHYVASDKTEDLDECDFTTLIDTLQEGVTYYVKAYARNIAGYGYSAETSFITATAVTITTNSPTYITGFSAVSGGEITDIGYSPVTVRGICWDTLPDPDISLTTKTTENMPSYDDGLGTFNANMTDLIPGTKYYVKAYAINGAGVTYGNLDSLTTLDYPKVTTLAVASFSSNTGTGGGNITDDGRDEITERGVCWGLTEDPIYASRHTSDGTGSGVYTSTLTGLIADTTYHVRAYARNSVGLSYGEDVTFVRIGGLASVVTDTATNITSTSAETGGAITNTGGLTISSKGFIYCQGSDPLLNDSIVVDKGSGAADFSTTFQRLLGDTTYYVRAFATNSNGTAYGNLVYFRTLPPVLPSISTRATISSIKDISAIGSLEIYSNGGAPIVARGIALSSDKKNYIPYPSSSVSSSDIGTFTSQLTGLIPKTIYYARGYAINSVGTIYTSEDVMFTTLDSLQNLDYPKVTTLPVTSFYKDTGIGGGNITDNGGAPITERGVCWGLLAAPTYSASSHTSDGTGKGFFSSTLTGLMADTTYHVRAYARNAVGLAYGNDLTFNRSAGLATVITNAVDSITSVSAFVGGEVSADGGFLVTARGIIYSPTGDPVLESDMKKYELGSDTGHFSTVISSLYGNTDYYVRAYATNGNGTAYGKLVNFKTLSPVYPTLQDSISICSIKDTSAVGTGTVLSNGGSPVTERGIYLSSDKINYVCYPAPDSISNLGNFVSQLTGLTPGTTYYAKGYATNSVGTVYTKMEITFTTFSPVLLTTTPATSITGESATSGGNITSNGGSPVTARGVCWSVNPDPDINDSHTNNGTGTGSYSSNITGLNPGTKYYIRAYATNEIRTYYGNSDSLTTLSYAKINTLAISVDASGNFSGGGLITSNGGTSITSRGVCWATTSSPTINDSNTSDGTGSGLFTSTLTGFASDVTYYIRAYAINQAGTAYGNEVSYTIDTSKAIVTTRAASQITSYSAQGGGTVVSEGKASVTSRGIFWSITGDPASDLSAKLCNNGSGTGAFTCDMTELLGDTVFYVRAYADNSYGRSYGKIVTFRTKDAVKPQVASVINIYDITGFTAKGTLTIENNGGSVVTARGICISPDGLLYNDYFLSPDLPGTDIGTYISEITGLSPGTTYYAKGYATNKEGTAYSDVLSFTTVAPPTLTTTAISDIAYNTAISGGTITATGGDSITYRGICWSIGSNPTVNLSTKTEEAITSGNGLGTFIDTLTNLLPGTVYFVRAYASNCAGTAYGNEVSFTTSSPVTPIVKTLSCSNVNGISASVLCEVTDEGGSTVTSRGLCWSVVAAPDTTGPYLSSGDGLGSYTIKATGLSPGLTYSVRAYAVNSAGVSYGNVLTITTAVKPTVKTASVSNVTRTDAICGGTVNSDGGDSVTVRGICWGTVPNPTTTSNNYTEDGTGTGSFTSALSGLQGSQTYYVRAYATNTAGTGYGSQKTFTTPIPCVATVTTDETNNIGWSSTDITGTVSNNGGSTVTERGFCWSTSSNPTVSSSHIVCGSNDGTFTCTASGLAANTTYYVKAYAINGVGVSYGQELTFTTTTSPSLPTISTVKIYDVTGYSAKALGEITDDGGDSVSISGFCWNTTGSPTLANDSVSGTIGMGQFILPLTGLKGNTIYYVRAYATNSIGTIYGNQLIFQTGAPQKPTVLTSAGQSGTDGTTASCGGNVTNNGGNTITVRGICWCKISGFSPDTISNNKTFQSGDTGEFTSSLTGLTPGTDYYVRAYATNAVGTTYGDEITFKTNSIPTITTTPVTGITSVAGETGGTITDNGGTEIVESGVCWSTLPYPTVSDDVINNGTGSGSFTSTIENLMGSTTYYVRAYAKNEVGIAYGNQETFTTDAPVLPTIKTGDVTLTSAISANCDGHIISNGGAVVTTRGVFWCTQPNFAVDTIVHNRTAETGYFTGSFTHSMKELKKGTTYYVKAYVVNSVGMAIGEEVSFTLPDVPTISTAYTYAIGCDKGSSGGDISDDGGADVTLRGVMWSTSVAFKPDTVKHNITYDGSGKGAFISSIEGLKGNTTYYVMAYARNVAGTGYGNMLSFTTDPATVPTVVTRSAWYIRGYRFTSGGNITSTGGEPVTSRGLVWSTVSRFKQDTVKVNIVSQVGSGTGLFSTTATGLKSGTTYYYRAFAQNSVGKGYGKEMSFTTLTIPEVTTSEVLPSANGVTASGGGEILDDGGTTITNRGVCWDIAPDPTISLSTKTSGDSGNPFSSLLSGLTPGETYYAKAYATNCEGTGYGENDTFTTPPVVPSITTTYATVLTKSSVSTGGTITDKGGAEITERGVLWSFDSDFLPDTVTVKKVISGKGDGSFTSVITGMPMSTSCYIRAYATNSAGTGYGNQVTVTIFPTAPILSTDTVINIGGYLATSGGEIISDGGADITQKGLCWATHTNPTISDDYYTNDGKGDDPYSRKITGLTPNTVYYVRAYAINKIGVGYGLERTFITDGFPVLSATTKVYDIRSTTATSGGTITDDGRSDITARGVCWSVFTNPTITASSKTVDDTTSGIGNFVAYMTNLSPEQKYYVRAFATNAVGTAYGSQVSFITNPVTLPTVVTISPSRVDSTMAYSGGKVLNDGGMPVNVRGICWSMDKNPTEFLTSKMNDSIGGTGTYNLWAQGLLPGKKYYIRAYATNSLGTGYGDLDSLTTISIRPIVSVPVLTDPTMTTITALASVVTDGGATVTDKGFYWNTTGLDPVLPMPADSMVSVGAGDTIISSILNGLKPAKTYYVWAYATNMNGTRFSEEPAEITTPTIPSVETTPSKSVLRFTAVCGGNVTDDGGSSILTRGVCYCTTGNPTISDMTDTTVYAATGAYSMTLDSLEERTTYYIRAFATNIFGTAYGETDTFSTLAIPVVTTQIPADSVWSSGILTGGEVVADGGRTVTRRGVCWSSIQIPDISLSTRTINGSDTGKFVSTIQGLEHDSVYFVVAYATNTFGTAYGEIDTIRTAPIIPTLSVAVIDQKDSSTLLIRDTILDDGGADVIERGICWSDKGYPTINDNKKVSSGKGLGIFNDSISGLKEGVTYYVLGYAINSVGVAYSPATSCYKVCPSAFTVMHLEGLNGAPVSKDVVYHSISTDITGSTLCWLTQNLGADTLASAVNDSRELSAGWYWQFNRSQGYNHDGTTRTPSTTWQTSISENSNWSSSNDPCNLLLGMGWRLPTYSEWYNADGGNSKWTKASDTYGSDIKLHMAGYLYYSNGTLTNRGSQGRYWSSNRYGSSNGYHLYTTSTSSSMTYMSKAYALPVRCVRDTIVQSLPVVSNVALPDSSKTASTAKAWATVVLDGGSVVTERGICWNTAGMPTVADSIIKGGAGLGEFSGTLSGLTEGQTYYFRAYAINSKGTVYSPDVSAIISCPDTFDVIHIERLSGAAESKTITYHSIATDISGQMSCWLTQNLGAEKQAATVADNSDEAAGWYWQFNRPQGYIHSGTYSYKPRYGWESWISSNPSSSDWTRENDPCNLLLGTGWRLPTKAEWTTADAAPQNWTTGAQAYNSVLKLHYSGYFTYNTRYSRVYLNSRGSYGYYWSSTQTGSNGYILLTYASNSYVTSFAKTNAATVRCIRQTITRSGATVSDVAIPDSTITSTTAKCSATVTLDGGSSVTDRGICWSTTNTKPVVSDKKIAVGSGTGSFTGTMGGLEEGPTYYVRAYAVNSIDTVYSASTTQFKICPRSFEVIHTEGLNGAPVDKIVNYHSVSSSITGKALCWLTQNLGADQEATSVSDATEKSAGWYWQFNKKQGYKHDGSKYVPSNSYTSWTSSISENSNWNTANDPCNLLLGLGWRLPTKAEWTTADAAPQYWTKASEVYSSALKLHMAGYLNYNNGSLANRGSQGRYWSSDRNGSSYGYHLYTTTSSSSMTYMSKAYALPVRCVRDSIKISVPDVSDFVVPDSTMTATSATGTATVASNGGSNLKERGICWSTTGTPTTNDHLQKCKDVKLGSFTQVLKSLSEDSAYYVRAYAINGEGVGYSPNVTKFRVCPLTFKAIHIERLSGAAETKTITYHSISSGITGTPSCWLTQNLGAEKQAATVDDKSDEAAGWYWQFNRKQGYIANGSSYKPKYAYESWTSSISENLDWSLTNDPCNNLLGTGWRLPTKAEWTAADAAPQNWTSPAMAFNSVLKLHYAGYLYYYYGGRLYNRGTNGFYWSSNRYNSSNGYYYYLNSTAVTYRTKVDGLTVRCIRQTIKRSGATVSDVDIPDSTITSTTAKCSATVTLDGGSSVTDRGICWSTTNTKPVVSDKKIAVGSGTGSFTGTMGGLEEGPTYYVRAYAVNSIDTVYSASTTQFKICPRSFEVIHTEGLNGAPVDKIVNYHSVSSSITGKALCWLTQNLGADQEATSVSDATEKSAGWYWQFNKKQGYKHDGSKYVPSNSYTSWTSSISENSNWNTANDPCNLLLGLGWRLPTKAEWTTADAAPQYWTKASEVYSSALKLHMAGYLNYNNGSLANRGSQGRYWSSDRNGSSYGYHLYTTTSSSSMTYMSKAYALPVRCVRDSIKISVPDVSDFVVPDSTMTATSATGTATVASNGGSNLKERGICWSTTGTPTTSDHLQKCKDVKLGSFTQVLKSLSEDSVYYVRAYAINGEGVGYSPNVTKFRVCPLTFKAIHIERLSGAAETKTITYHSISSGITGTPSCWLTQNLGAEKQAATVADKSDEAAGWYWQFNRPQGYIHSGTYSYKPRYGWESWISSNPSSSDWTRENDPCNLLLGTGWRLPTQTEWTTADAAPQNWTTGAQAYNSVLKLHYSGYFSYNTKYSRVYLNSRGSYGYYWSSTQTGSNGYILLTYASNSYVTSFAKTNAATVRCIRQTITRSGATVSDVDIPDATITSTTAKCSATVTLDGGSTVTTRGFCWNTTGSPTVSDNKKAIGSGTGSFSGNLTGLSEGTTYYVRAYATNSQGIAYSSVASFKVCPKSFSITHTAGVNGAPVTKTVTYHSVSSNISGKALCWLTQNLGADQEATSVSDATEKSAGWYWQFNTQQGYKHDGSSRTPSSSWTSSLSGSNGWVTANDPCASLLGSGWRIPTQSEWYAADAQPQYWVSASDAYESDIKLHMAGFLNSSNGTLNSRGSQGRYWSSTQINSSSGYYLYMHSSTSSVTNMSKAYALPVRCVKD